MSGLQQARPRVISIHASCAGDAPAALPQEQTGDNFNPRIPYGRRRII